MRRNIPPLSAVHPHARGADVKARNLYAFEFRRFIPTHVGRIYMIDDVEKWNDRFIPTHVGRMKYKVCDHCGAHRFIPTHVGRMIIRFPIHAIRNGSSPRTWGGYFPKCSYGWILMNCKPSKSMMVRRGFPYVSMEKPCSLLVE